MGKHLVIGLGNLGADLVHTLRERGEDVTVCARGWAQVIDETFTTVWCCAGAGGPGDGVENMLGHIEANVLLPSELIRRAYHGTRLVFFSSHYLNFDEHGTYSFYAKTKSILEGMVTARPNAVVYRVGSLYGRRFPTKCFPHKLLQKKEATKLPLNVVTPTPTDWLAERLVQLEERKLQGIYRVGPNGYTSVYHWGLMITCLAVAGDIDKNYPSDCAMETVPDQPFWTDLWNTRAGWFRRL